MAETTSQPLSLFAVILRRWTRIGVALVFIFSLTAWLPYIGLHALIDLPSHFILQYLIGAGVLAFVGLYARIGWRWYLVLAVAAGLCFFRLSPWLPATPPAAQAHGSPLKILQANVLFLNKDPARLRQLIVDEKPDIIILAEANTVFTRMLGGLRNNYPYQDAKPDDHGADGLAVASRRPLKNLRTVTWPAAEMPAYVFSFALDKKTVRFVSLHTPNPVNDIAGRDATFTGFEKEVADASGPVIVAGDFNATPWCPALRGVMERNPRLHNAREHRGLFLSWPTFFPAFMRIPIDETLFSDDMMVLDYRLGPQIGSDHLPVISTLAAVK